jgi:cellulose synthase/poly-beta-1,6-N-acetylglucosamine synthase-like glycosyltransferase
VSYGTIANIGLLSAVVLVTIWVIYPGVIGALALVVRRNTVPVSDHIPFVSIVIGTREPAPAIERRVADCLNVDYPPDKLEWVVALDARGGVTPADLAKIDERVKVVMGDEPGGKAAALNAAVRASRGELVVFTDTYQRFHPQAIRRLVSAMKDPVIGVVSGSLKLAVEREVASIFRYYWRFERWLRDREARVHSSVGVTGAIYVLRRSLWRPLPAGLILDDVFTPMTVVMRGYRVGFVESAHAFETRRHTLGQEYRRKVRTLTGVVQLCAWMPGTLAPLRNPIWIQFVFHKLLRLLTPYCVLGIGLWFSALGLTVLDSYLAVGVALVLGVAAWGVLSEDGSGARVRGLVVQVGLLQAATIVGTVNGLMGRWDVWDDR